MSIIKNVAVIGGGGNLGPSVVQALSSSGFTVTAITRIDSKSVFPAEVRVYRTDYNSPSSLAEALNGQDAVVSTIATAASAQQKNIIEAAVQAGVKRFIPSEYGINTTNLQGGPAKILSSKVQMQELLKKASSENAEFSWTGVSTGLFFDFGLRIGSLGFSIPDRTATIYDSGNEPFTGTNLTTIGLAIVSILNHPAETADRYLDIASFTTTQNEILAVLEEETKSKWTVTRVETDDSLKTADEKFAKGDYSAFSNYLKVYLFRDGEGKSPDKVANGELGLPKEDLRRTIKEALS